MGKTVRKPGQTEAKEVVEEKNVVVNNEEKIKETIKGLRRIFGPEGECWDFEIYKLNGEDVLFAVSIPPFELADQMLSMQVLSMKQDKKGPAAFDIKEYEIIVKQCLLPKPLNEEAIQKRKAIIKNLDDCKNKYGGGVIISLFNSCMQMFMTSGLQDKKKYS